ncbi:2OG-Fe(II) oxygenase superfamily protein [Dactylonectria macrodidyma]|uniref:2OG-Fe(II) oxygenase superfamily protein n=1 Tax=Dactylonectria macrodidyma TaxID=307937 RepID=A0A9P9EKC3_9HYPO|nr:2OG-Fe(II) oxygenase superfamily protein [Dactylonectria macrodidyma]
MATTTMTAAPAPETYKLELMSAYGSVFRDVLKTAPRDCDASEVPTIDLSNVRGTESERRALAKTIQEAAENTGFFYIKNHGIPQAHIDAAFKQAQTFFSQPTEKKAEVSGKQSKFYNGWSERRETKIATESRDHREGFSFRYDPKYDPETKDLDAIPEEVKAWLRCEDFVWDRTTDLPNFKHDMIAYWQSCLTLARSMIRIFALALDAPEDYFDDVVTYPGSDSVVNYYPKNTKPQDANVDVGLGSHTDLQCFTLLWQDQVGGLQVLNKEGQWIKVPPVPGTFVVNIGDFLMRLSNDRFQSTVHRVYNYAAEDRYSMPFFFGFNFNEKCEVIPSCASEENPPKYEPISCGEWCRLRFEKTYRKS